MKWILKKMYYASFYYIMENYFKSDETNMLYKFDLVTKVKITHTGYSNLLKKNVTHN
jgi:hypothetical protein